MGERQSLGLRDDHPLANKTVRLNDTAADPVQGAVVPGARYVIENWWVNVSGASWQAEAGNWGCMHYAFRRNAVGLPLDDEVVYGKIDGLGHIVHVSELGEVV